MATTGRNENALRNIRHSGLPLRSFCLLAVLVSAALIASMVPAVMSASPPEIAAGQPPDPYQPNPYNAGLSEPFQFPDPSDGQTISILAHGATANDRDFDNAAAIQKAINAAEPGDEVYIPNGIYHIKRDNIRLKTGVSLRGESRDSTILRVVLPSHNADIGVLHGVDVANFSISNFKMEKGGGPSISSFIRIGGTSSRIDINNMHINGFFYTSVHVTGSSKHVLIRDSVIENGDPLDASVFHYGILVEDPGTNNNWVYNNIIGPRTAPSYIRHCITMSYSTHNNLIENNTCHNAIFTAIDIHGHDEHHLEIRGNTVVGSQYGGISVGNKGKWVEGDPYGYDSGPNNWIHHNEVFHAGSGMTVQYRTHQQTIEDNYFHDNNYGIGVVNEGGDDLIIRRNRIENSFRQGLHLTAGRNVLIEENLVTGSGEHSIYGFGGFCGYIIRNNDLRNNGQPATLECNAGTFTNNQQ